mmetsp:Transcript_20325/g.26374  ORF Transcript_20325/g.26374 Transcript_20325/m.26374 type:complete len:351 (+) Transcript_20325:226-1278(+)
MTVLGENGVTEDSRNVLQGGESEVIFMGTGSSTGTPMISCLVGLSKSDTPCVCLSAVQGDPCENKNNRLNPSLLLRFRLNNSDSTRHVLFDCCKTFREAAVRWFSKFSIPYLDAVILSHRHADAILGIDDLRMAYDTKSGPLPVYMSEKTFGTIKNVFPYLVNSQPSLHGSMVSSCKNKHRDQPAEAASAWVAKLDWRLVSRPSLDDPFSPFDVHGIEVIPFPVFHGEPVLSLGFLMGKGEKKFVYISDISTLPENVERFLLQYSIDLFICDGLGYNSGRSHSTHQNIDDAVLMAKTLNAKKTLIVGISHRVDHETTNEALKSHLVQEGLDIQLAYDGQSLRLDTLGITL